MYDEHYENLSKKELFFFQEQERVSFCPGEEGQGVRWGLPGQEATTWKVILIDLTTFSVEQDWEPSCQLQQLAHGAGDEAWRVGRGRILPWSNWEFCWHGDLYRFPAKLTTIILQVKCFHCEYRVWDFKHKHQSAWVLHARWDLQTYKIK